MLKFLSLILSLALLAGCTSGNDVIVMAETDLRPGTSRGEFDSVRVTLHAGGQLIAETEGPSSELVLAARRSTRVALFRSVAAGDYIARVALLAGGTELLARRRSIHVSTDFVVTVVLDSECTSLRDGRPLYEVCEDSDLTCVAGECVEPDCDTAEGCGTTQCAVDTECPSGGCLIGRCADRTCLASPNDALCADTEYCSATGCTADDRTCTRVALFEDRDGDGVGGRMTMRCPGPGLVRTGGDCNDDSPLITTCAVMMDGGPPRDAGPLSDAGMHDAATDAGRAESCTPTASGAVDEDGDGRVDEGCSLHVDSVHGIHFDTDYSISGMEPSADGLRVYAATAPGIVTVTRPNLTARFGDPVVTPITGLAAGTRVWVVTLRRRQLGASAPDLEAFAQIDGFGAIQRLTRTAITEPFTLDGPVMVSTAASPVGFHPFLSDDGTELFYVDGSMGGSAGLRPIRIARRSDPASAVFDEDVDSGLVGDYPTLAPDGRTLFVVPNTGPAGVYRRGDDGVFLAVSDSPIVATRPVFHPATREVFSRLGRGRYCLEAECAPISFPCVAPSSRDNFEGFRCTTVELTPTTFDAAPCSGTTRDSYHLYIGSRPGLIVPAGGGWVGLRESVDGMPVWVTGQTIPIGIVTGAPGLGCYAVPDRFGRLEERDCATLAAPICMREVWPTWSPGP